MKFTRFIFYTIILLSTSNIHAQQPKTFDLEDIMKVDSVKFHGNKLTPRILSSPPPSV